MSTKQSILAAKQLAQLASSARQSHETVMPSVHSFPFLSGLCPRTTGRYPANPAGPAQRQRTRHSSRAPRRLRAARLARFNSIYWSTPNRARLSPALSRRTSPSSTTRSRKTSSPFRLSTAGRQESAQQLEVILLLDLVNSPFEQAAIIQQQIVKYLQQNGGHLPYPTRSRSFQRRPADYCPSLRPTATTWRPSSTRRYA